MTAIAPLEIFQLPSSPPDPTLAVSRKMLLANRNFLGFFEAIKEPAAMLSMCHRLVLANDAMVGLLNLESDEEALGAVLGHPSPDPGQPGLHVQTRYLEIKGLVFFVLTLHSLPV